MPDFMLLLQGGDYEDLSPEQMQRVVQQYIDWAAKLRKRGILKGGDELKSSGRVLIGGEGGITDGPFTESKEAVGGYFLIEAADYDAAVEITRECPALQHNGRVEIRQISDYD